MTPDKLPAGDVAAVFLAAALVVLLAVRFGDASDAPSVIVPPADPRPSPAMPSDWRPVWPPERP